MSNAMSLLEWIRKKKRKLRSKKKEDSLSHKKRLAVSALNIHKAVFGDMLKIQSRSTPDIRQGYQSSTYDVTDLVDNHNKKMIPELNSQSVSKFSDTSRDENLSNVEKVKCDSQLYVALFDYYARTGEDLSFRKGEHLEIIHKNLEGWWWARSRLTRLEGYIPREYIAQLQSIEAEPWYFGELKRMEAERILASDANDHGSFLIRKAEKRKNEFSLSVRDGDRTKHYRIRVLEGRTPTYFVSRDKKMTSLQDLVQIYSQDNIGLCTHLVKPCVKVDKPSISGLSHNTLDVWEIPKQQFVLGRLLGSGHFGDVFEGLWNQSVPVAVKVMKPGVTRPQDFIKEMQTMKKLRHPKLIQLYAVCSESEPVYIVTELMSCGSLIDCLRGDKLDLNFADQLNVSFQVSSGMAYLELHNFIHRDLAARNVLVSDGLVCKIADFGLSRLIQEDEYQAQVGAKFPIRWTAPEALQFGRFTIKSDIWSFGVLLFEVTTSGVLPYAGLSNSEVVSYLEKGYRMPQPPSCSDAIYELMLRCWAENPSNRPSFLALQAKFEEEFCLINAEYGDTLESA